jgi:hypothetical protein
MSENTINHALQSMGYDTKRSVFSWVQDYGM